MSNKDGNSNISIRKEKTKTKKGKEKEINIFQKKIIYCTKSYLKSKELEFEF